MWAEPKRTSRLYYVNWWLVVAATAFCCLVASCGRQYTPQSKTVTPTLRLEDAELAALVEALSVIQHRAMFISRKSSRYEIIQEALKAYLTKQDRFSDYLSRDEYQRFKGSMGRQYTGVGMELDRQPDGSVICFPYPDSVAIRSGLRAGDRLTHVNGRSIDGRSLAAIGAMARGSVGSKVSLMIVRNEEVREFDVPLERTSAHDVVLEWVESLPVIKIQAFSSSTVNELVTQLKRLKREDTMVVLDVRGNRGGDFDAAVDAARVFLDTGKTIVSVKERKGVVPIRSDRPGFFLSLPVYIWQDEATASAAEMFVAALVQNNRAQSLGRRSYGKGTKQDIIDLSDGSALLLTTGYLLTPNGTTYDKVGIEASFPFVERHSETKAYLVMLKKLLASNVKGSAG